MLRPYTRGQAGSRASVELLKARGDRGVGGTVSPVSATSSSSGLCRATGPPSLPALSWPHGRSPDQVCLQKHTRKQNISMFPVWSVETLVLFLYRTHFQAFLFFLYRTFACKMLSFSLSPIILWARNWEIVPEAIKWSEHGNFMSSNICSVKASDIYQVNSCTQRKH